MAQLGSKMDMYEQAIDTKLTHLQSQYSTLDTKIRESEQMQQLTTATNF